MKKTIFVASWLLFQLVDLTAQSTNTSLYMPLEFQRAYKKGTRNYDGTVSDTYWQNHADYQIKAKVDVKKKLLSASANITYYNESPDSLYSIVFQAYPDYYKKGAAKAGFFGGEYDPKLESDGMVIEKLTIDGKEINIKDENNVTYNGTNYRIYLDRKIASKDNVKLEVKWHYTIPGKGFERSGAIDPTSMFIGYWYPEISVKDDINSWDDILYDASAEFYHDNSNYDIEIEVPKGYLVWGPVEPSNIADIFPSDIMSRLETAKNSATSVPIVTEADLKKGLKLKTNVWKFTAKNFPDFAFALSNHFVWDAASYSDSYGQYFLHTAYDPKHTAFKDVVKTEQEAIKTFHNDFPKYEFPYHYFTIFNGIEGGGMEFPGMANDESISATDWEEWTGEKKTDFEVNFGLSLHEMCHMYYPFLMGINEKKYAWMDEGLATFSEYFIDGESTEDYPYYYLGDQSVTPMMTPTFTQPRVSSVNSYDMGGFSYYSLYHLLGKDLFTKCMNAYMDRWNHKHPTPYDFFYTFNDVSGQNLDWFWKNWYFDWGYPDLAITQVGTNIITIENLGRKAIAFTLIVTYEDGNITKTTISPEVWKVVPAYIHYTGSDNKIKSVQLQTLTGCDAVKENNYWPEK
jgi:hypothetical protein